MELDKQTIVLIIMALFFIALFILMIWKGGEYGLGLVDSFLKILGV